MLLSGSARLLVAAAAVALLLVASVSALPSGDVVQLNAGGYFRLQSMNGFDVTSGNSEWTVSAWIYGAADSDSFAIMTFGHQGWCNGEAGLGAFNWYGTQPLTMLACNIDGSQGKAELRGAWHHVAVAHSPSWGSKGYVDGALEFSSGAGLTNIPDAGMIGARTADGNPSARGTFWLDDLRVWSQALSQSDVRFDMSGGAVLTGLISNFDGSTSGGNLADVAGSNNAAPEGTAPVYTTTARCPVSTYIASCGKQACRYLLADPSIPMCGPCSRGYTSAVFANLTGYCDLDLPNVPTAATASTSSKAGCVDLSAQWPVISAAITSFTFTRADNGAVSTADGGVATSTGSVTVCGLKSGTYTWAVSAVNAAGAGATVKVSAAAVASVASTCGAGYKTSASGSCVACAVGSYSTSGAASVCAVCAPGSRTLAAGATACTTCNPGTYGPASANGAECKMCAPGWIQPASGASACEQCAVGKYQCSKAGTTCNACAVGKYAPTVGYNSVCSECPVGQYTAATGSSACGVCKAGSYAASVGKTACVACAAGSVSASGVSTCSNCAAGKFASASGSSVCVSCAAGSYAASAVSSSCTVCAAGSYAASAGSTTCASCSKASARTAGASSCIETSMLQHN